MSNIKVSSDIDTFLKKSTKEEAALFLGLQNSGQVETNKTNIATNTADIAINATGVSTNSSNIATNTADIAINTTGIATNATAIATKANQSQVTSLSSDVTDHTTDILSNYNSIVTLNNDLNSLGSYVTTNTTDIATNAQSISDNTYDISQTVAQVNTKAPLASPSFTGTPTAPTASSNDNSTKIATTAYVDAVTAPNNKGFFATESALTTAYSSGQDGWFAIVGATDTFWVWDSGTSDWVDTNSNSQGTVTSINILDGTGITSSGGPVTSSGSITVGLDSSTQTTLNSVSTNASDIATNTADIATNATAINTNTSNIATNTSNIATNTSGIATNTSNIATNTSDIATNTGNISTNTSNIATNTSNIATNASDIATNTSNISSNSSSIVANTANVATNASNIATNSSAIATNASDIATNATAIAVNTAKVGITTAQASAITANTAKVGITTSQANAITSNTSSLALKAPLADPSFTGSVGIGKTATSSVALDINGEVLIENGKISGDTGSLDFDSNQAQLILGTIKSDALKVTRVDANSTIVFNVDASSETDGKATMLNAQVENDLTVSGDADVTGDLTVDGTTTLKDNVVVNNGDITVSDTAGNGTGGNVIAEDITANDKLHVKEIQALGSTGSTTLPIVYDAIEHRFRDFDSSPSDLMVIEKINGYTGGRVGINKDPSANNAVALHVVAGKNASTNVRDEALKVVGRAFFDDSIRIGHYLDSERPTETSTPAAQNGMVIYNSTHNEFQGFVGGEGWQKFFMVPVST
jgi:hypothetical protein